MRDRMSNLISGAGGGIVAVALTFAVRALAGDGVPTTDDVPRTMVYQGYLEHDGQAVSEPQDLEFRIFNTPTGGTAVYTETETGVPVYRGRFSVTLGDDPGSPGAFESIIRMADDLYVEITVLGTPDPGDDVALVGRQPLVPTPFAIWSRRSTDFTVEDTLTAQTATATDLTVTNTCTVTGPTQLGQLTVNGPTIMNGQLTFDVPTSPSAYVTAHYGAWGNWQDYYTLCPASTYVCGYKVRFEDSVGSADDTALNAVSLACCPFGG